MAVVDAALHRRRPGERDHLVAFGEALWRIEETGREAERAVAHRLVDEADHLVQFGRRRRAVVGTDHLHPHRAEADIGREIDAVIARRLDEPFEFPLSRLQLGQAEDMRSEEHTSELQSLMRNSYAVF